VAIAYSSLPTPNLYTPTADLDVVVAQIDPVTGGTIHTAAWSGFIENNIEMVEFRAEQDGTFQA